MDQPLNVLNSDNSEDIKNFLSYQMDKAIKPPVPQEELEKSENMERMQLLSDFLSEMKAACEEHIKHSTPSEELDLLCAFMWKYCQELKVTENLTEAEKGFFANLKSKYDKFNSGKLRGLIGSAATLGADAISPELGKVVQFIFAQDK